MGIFSSPKKPQAPAEDRQQLAIAANQRGTAVGFRPAIQQRLADIANIAPERAEQRGYASADIAQRTGPLTPGRMTPFQRAMQRGSALSRIARAGDSALEMQQLRDRAAMSKFGQGLQAGAAGDYSTLSGISALYDAQRMRAEQNRNAATTSLLGTAAGVAANYGSARLMGDRVADRAGWKFQGGGSFGNQSYQGAPEYSPVQVTGPSFFDRIGSRVRGWWDNLGGREQRDGSIRLETDAPVYNARNA